MLSPLWLKCFFCLVLFVFAFCVVFCGAIAVSAILQIHNAMLHLRSTWRLRLAPVWPELFFCLVSCILWFPCGFCECVAISHFSQIHPTMPHLRSAWRLKLSGVWLEFFFCLVFVLLGCYKISVKTLLLRMFSNEPCHAAPSSYVTVDALSPVARVFLFAWFCLCLLSVWFLWGHCCFRSPSNTQCHAATSPYPAAEARSPVARVCFLLGFVYSLFSVRFL